MIPSLGSTREGKTHLKSEKSAVTFGGQVRGKVVQGAFWNSGNVLYLDLGGSYVCIIPRTLH